LGISSTLSSRSGALDRPFRADATCSVLVEERVGEHHRGALVALQGFILRHVTGSSGGPRVARLFMVKDRKAYDPAAVLRRVAASLRWRAPPSVHGP
jgi:hypothetical protein